jgi:hypothetical protein
MAGVQAGLEETPTEEERTLDIRGLARPSKNATMGGGSVARIFAKRPANLAGASPCAHGHSNTRAEVVVDGAF